MCSTADELQHLDVAIENQLQNLDLSLGKLMHKLARVISPGPIFMALKTRWSPMLTNQTVKSLLHLVAALFTIFFVARYPAAASVQVLLGAAAAIMLVLAGIHHRIWPRFTLKTSVFFLLESIVLSVMAWLLYQQGHHKPPFLYEGVGIFYLSMAAFSFLLRRKRSLVLSDLVD